MPPAFVLSQDQTLTLELQISKAHPHGQTIETQKSQPLLPHLIHPELTIPNTKMRSQWLYATACTSLPKLSTMSKNKGPESQQPTENLRRGRWSQSDRIYGGRPNRTTRATYRKNPTPCPEDKAPTHAKMITAAPRIPHLGSTSIRHRGRDLWITAVSGPRGSEQCFKVAPLPGASLRTSKLARTT